MPNFIDKMRSFIKPPVLSPDERWIQKSKRCHIDLKIKDASIKVLKAASIGTGVTSLVVPTLAIALPTGGLSLAVGAAVIAVAGIAAAVLGVYKSEGLRKTFDWTDYSNKAVVKQDMNRLTQLDMQVLAAQPQSPLHRIKNLKRYGVISSKSADRMKGLYKNYVRTQKVCEKLAYDNPIAYQTEGSPAFSAYHQQQDKLDAINHAWKQFQLELVNDLPKIG